MIRKAHMHVMLYAWELQSF